MLKFGVPRKILFAAACCLSLCAAPAFAFRAVPVGNFADPVDIRVAPGQPNNLYVVEQSGKIKVLQNEVPAAAPFLNIEGIVDFNDERGLLSLAFAPNYATSRRFYVLFVNNFGNVEVDEFLRSPTNPLRTQAGSRRVLLRIPHPNASNHNGGQLQFGTDGFLYISVGDGGNTPTPGEPARDLRSLLGKILRINPLPAGGNAYQIPPGNPYVGVFGRDEIYAYGLRNPWRMSLTPNFIAIGDVGQGREEEVNILRIPAAKGVNFGWPQFEGNLVYDNSKPGRDPAVFPIHTYSHDTGGCAVMGGHIVADTQLPALQGRYIYGDLCTGQIRSFLPDVAAQKAIGDSAIGISLPGLRSFGRGTNSQVYMSDGGKVYRLEP
jgi:glucose/arabinose dehydrogenase